MKMIHKVGNTYKGVKIIVYFITTMNSSWLKVIKNVSGWLLQAEREGWAKWTGKMDVNDQNMQTFYTN